VAIRIDVDAGKLTAGQHGIRISERADCSQASARTAAQYGLLNIYGAEPGAAPILTVSADQPATGEFLIRAATLAPASRIWTPLLDADGSALIVHALAEPVAPPAAPGAQPAQAPAPNQESVMSPALGACAAITNPIAPAAEAAPAAPVQ
jgi:hypothetical protein